jgi:hypothetical protein
MLEQVILIITTGTLKDNAYNAYVITLRVVW